MASIKPYKDGWRAQVKIAGVRDSDTFRTKRDAQTWAAQRETELRAQATQPAGERKTLLDALRQYKAEVTPSKRGKRWESLRIDAFMRSTTLPLNKPMAAIEPSDFADWRDQRTSKVKAGTILREFGVLSAVFETARREWRWIKANPVADVRKPPQPDHREVVIHRWQIKRMLRALNYAPRGPIKTKTQACAVAFLVALRSGMRAGELCGLEWTRLHDSWCVLKQTKTKPRDVPLTPKARRTIERMRGFHPRLIFGVAADSLDTLFRRARNEAGLDGFTFHDSRHTAATWIVASGKWNVLELCKAFGWKDPKRAMTYFNPKASDLADKLR